MKLHKSPSIRVALAGIALTGFAVACSEVSMPEPDEGALLFAANCTTCHGSDGKGAKLASGRQAPDLTTIARRNKGEFPRARVLSQIDGYGRGALPPEAMPEFGALLKGDTVPVEVDGVLTPTPRPLAALLAYLENIQTP
ncbi:MAG: cytochrome c [Arenibacterium sp.]